MLSKTLKGIKQSFRLRMTLFLLLVAVMASVLLIAWLLPSGPADSIAFWRESARVTSVDVQSDGRLDTVVLTFQDGRRVLGLVRRSARSDPAPAVVLLGGHETGRMAALLAPVDSLVVAAIDYPYDGPVRLRQWPTDLKWIPEIHRSIDLTPAVVMAFRNYLATRPDVRPDSIVGVGVSFGGVFLLAAQSASSGRDSGFAGIAVHHCGARLKSWTLINLKRKLPSAAAIPLSRYLTARFVALEPARNLPRIEPHLPLLVTAGVDDERLDTDDFSSVYGSRAEIRWTEGGHVEPDRESIVAALIAETLAWMQREDFI